MGNGLDLHKDAMNMLKLTSRTFYIPITMLNKTLKMAVCSAYLCMRAIDEIEDHQTLDSEVKARLLRETGELLRNEFNQSEYEQLIFPYKEVLPEVTLRLGDWVDVCPGGIVDKVTESTRIMANGMADWVEKGWRIQTLDDLNDYTYYVAGLVGVMLSDIWYWYDQTETDPDLAVAFGKGLQAVNILRNQDEDFVERGVNFIPNGWNRSHMFDYAETNLRLADEYIKDIKTRNIKLFCRIPLALAKRTLKTMQAGNEKLTRQEVETIVSNVQKE